MVRHRRETYCRANKCPAKSPAEAKQLQAENDKLKDEVKALKTNDKS